MRNLLPGLIAFAFIFTPSSDTHAEAVASECKGLEQAACSANQQCSWVKSHKRGTGKDVSAFCRKKPERRKAVEAQNAPKG